jgi:AraC-like DNA-binding protein
MALILAARSQAALDPGASGPANRKMLHLRRFRALLDRGYRTHKSVAFYAGEPGITSTQLNRVYREVLGKSALGAINAWLLLEAERDLVCTFIGVKEIAPSLGFSDAAYFSGYRGRFDAADAALTFAGFFLAARAFGGADSAVGGTAGTCPGATFISRRGPMISPSSVVATRRSEVDFSITKGANAIAVLTAFLVAVSSRICAASARPVSGSSIRANSTSSPCTIRIISDLKGCSLGVHTDTYTHNLGSATGTLETISSP